MDEKRAMWMFCVPQVLASKSKIYLVLECASGGELFDRIVSVFSDIDLIWLLL